MPTCSAPVRRVSAPKDTPLDLHALGTPPALILSQDQTLHHCGCFVVSVCADRGSHPTPQTVTSPPGVCGRRIRKPSGCREDHDTISLTLTCAIERSETIDHSPARTPFEFQVKEGLPSARSVFGRCIATECSVLAKLPACQGIPTNTVQARDAAGGRGSRPSAASPAHKVHPGGRPRSRACRLY